MRTGALALLVFGVTSTAGLASSCTADQVLYGPPEGLAGRQVPPPKGGSSATPATDAGPSDLKTICGAEPPTVPTSGCDPAVWQATIYPKLKGEWTCAQIGCHNPGGTAPTVDDGAEGAKNTWTNFVNHKATASKRYVDPCTLDPNQSAIYCNLNFATGTCGSPMPKGKTLTAADKTLIENWLKCGARP